MSVFRVSLTNNQQGLLDTNGQASGTSIQRTAYLLGPDLVWHKLADGKQFTASNYWKQFVAAPVGTATAEFAALTLVTDDGSTYTPGATTLTTPYSWNAVSVVDGTTFTSPVVIDVLGTVGGSSTYAQITATKDMSMRINGNTNAIVTLASGVPQIFNPGDVSISKMEFANASGTDGTVDVFVTVAIPVT